MTLSTPSSGHAPGLSAIGGLTNYGPRTLDVLHSLEAGISAWCEWFGLEEPKLKLKLKLKLKREVLLNDELVARL